MNRHRRIDMWFNNKIVGNVFFLNKQNDGIICMYINFFLPIFYFIFRRFSYFYLITQPNNLCYLLPLLHICIYKVTYGCVIVEEKKKIMGSSIYFFICLYLFWVKLQSEKKIKKNITNNEKKINCLRFECRWKMYEQKNPGTFILNLR